MLSISEDEIRYFKQLDERQQRLYLGLKAKLLGVGGVQQVSEAFGIHANTIRKGKSELSEVADIPTKRIRQVGGGPKKIGFHPEWLLTFDRIIETSTAGLPQDPNIKWTHLTRVQLSEKMIQEGVSVSSYHIKQMLELRGYKKRKLLKINELKEVEGRNEQFEKIQVLRQTFLDEGLPILSIDTKKKELLGNFHRQGSTYSTTNQRVNDHDFLSFADGQLVPHGIYDIADNTGYLTLGNSKDTSEFVCDNLKSVWVSQLQFKYPHANTMLLLCDGGGSNSCLHYIFKEDLVKLSKQLEMNILVAHYPAYCSKYNPIEHRLFSQISHTWAGIPLKNIQFVKELTDKTTTKTGLKVITEINSKVYQTKREAKIEFKENIEKYILFDDKCPKWNYLIKVKK